jgi:hypothetical protein
MFRCRHKACLKIPRKTFLEVGTWIVRTMRRSGILGEYLTMDGDASLHRRTRGAWAAVAAACLAPVALALACSGQSQGGLVNVPSPSRAWTVDDRGHDAIANGQESCPPSGSAKDDPMPMRSPKCPETASSARGPAQSKSPPK